MLEFFYFESPCMFGKILNDAKCNIWLKIKKKTQQPSIGGSLISAAHVRYMT